VGVYVRLATNTTVSGNYIGLNAAGTAALGNTSEGVRIESGTGTTVGGLTATPGTGAGNVISGNLSGVSVVGGTDNTIQGNLVGTNAAGTAALGQAAGVIFASSANNNTVGATAAGARNVLSGNTSGVTLRLSAHNNVILGNYIGTDIGGTADLGNAGDGVHIELAATDNTIGGTSAAARNVISGNNGVGVQMLDS